MEYVYQEILNKTYRYYFYFSIVVVTNVSNQLVEKAGGMNAVGQLD